MNDKFLSSYYNGMWAGVVFKGYILTQKIQKDYYFNSSYRT